MAADGQHRNLRVLMFPHLAYGHITPFLGLAKKLSDRGFSIDFCSTPINLSFIKKKIPDKYSSSIQLVELHLPNLPELPPHYHTTHALPPYLGPTLFKAVKMAKPNFQQILKAQKPDLLIYDTIMQQWPAGIASTLNIPAIKLYVSCAAAISYYGHFHVKPGVEFPFPAIFLWDYERKKVFADVVVESEEREFYKDNHSECDRIILVNSSRAIDAKYMDYLSEISQGKVLPMGAPFPDFVTKEEGNMEDMELIKWLGEKKEHSTVYVCFGSEFFLTKEEMEEIAYGLELSNVHFIWVVRFPNGEEVKLEDTLPQGFLERIGERGKVVEGWVPQERILKHPSIGAFLSHCGWNSILETIEFGIPIIALPMVRDQPLSARLIVEIGVAVEVVRDGTGKFHRAKTAEIIKDVIFGDEIGGDLRRKVNSLGENMRLLREEEMDEVAEVITQLCQNNQSKNASA